MPTQDVTLTFPTTPPHLLDLDAVRLQAAKVVTPAATNSHGCQIQHIGPSATSGNPAAPTTAGSQVIVRVVT